MTFSLSKTLTFITTSYWDPRGTRYSSVLSLSWLTLGFISEPIALQEASSDLLRLSLLCFFCFFVVFFFWGDLLWHSLIAIITSCYNYFSVYFPYWIVDKQTGASVVAPAMQEMWVRSLSQEDPPKKGMTMHSLQYSCLANAMDRGAWQATVHGISKSRTWLSN